MRRRLIVLRAGDDSLHSSWGSGDWQLIHTYYGDHPPPDSIPIKGGKWDGIYQLFKQQPDLLKLYDTIWLPDDDIQTNARDIETLFSLHEKYHLQLSQPALTHDSHYSHFCLLQNKHFILRYSNFVEIMMPCFSAGLLRRALSWFEDNPTGYMLDKIWHRLADPPLYAAAVIDQIAMRHIRKVDHGSLNKAAHHLEKIQHLLPPRKQRRPIFYGGILRDNRKIDSARKMARFFLYALPSSWKQIRYQLTLKPDLSKIEPH